MSLKGKIFMIFFFFSLVFKIYYVKSESKSVMKTLRRQEIVENKTLNERFNIINERWKLMH